MAKKEKKVEKTMDVAQRVLSRAKETELFLSKDEKVMFMIPLDRGEKPGASHPVMINGYRTSVPKGRMVEIPRTIANLLAERFSVDLSQKRVDRSEATIRALS